MFLSFKEKEGSLSCGAFVVAERILRRRTKADVVYRYDNSRTTARRANRSRSSEFFDLRHLHTKTETTDPAPSSIFVVFSSAYTVYSTLHIRAIALI